MLTKREWLKAFDTDIDSDSCVVQVDSGAESKGEAGELTPVACGVLTLRRCTPHDNNVVVTVEETDPASEFSLVREIFFISLDYMTEYFTNLILVLNDYYCLGSMHAPSLLTSMASICSLTQRPTPWSRFDSRRRHSRAHRAMVFAPR